MSRLTVAFFLLCIHAGLANDCSFGTSSNFVEKAFNTCPGVFDSSDKSYCCFDLVKEKAYCCNAEEFALKTGFGIIIPVIITAAIIISLVVCCISCLCCSCCPWYRRRHQGTVYGKVQAPNVVHVVHTPANVPSSYSRDAQAQNQYVPYQTGQSSGYPQQPPPYTNEAYAKQAAYNPAYPPQ